MLCGFESARWQVQEEQNVYGPLKRQFERMSAASGNAPANAYCAGSEDMVWVKQSVGSYARREKILSNICPRGPKTLAIECS